MKCETRSFCCSYLRCFEFGVCMYTRLFTVRTFETVMTREIYTIFHGGEGGRNCLRRVQGHLGSRRSNSWETRRQQSRRVRNNLIGDVRAHCSPTWCNLVACLFRGPFVRCRIDPKMDCFVGIQLLFLYDFLSLCKEERLQMWRTVRFTRLLEEHWFGGDENTLNFITTI